MSNGKRGRPRKNKDKNIGESRDPISIARGITRILTEGIETCPCTEPSKKPKSINLGDGVYGYPSENEVRRWMPSPVDRPGLGSYPARIPPQPTDAPTEYVQASPSHYGKHGVQPIVFMVNNFSHEEFVGFVKGNIYKYLDRAPGKGGLSDTEKAKVYMDWLYEYEKTGQITVNGQKHGPGKPKPMTGPEGAFYTGPTS